MTRFQVDSEEVFNATGAVRASIAGIQAEAEALHSQLTALQGSWSGQAAAAFQSVILDWKGTQLRVDESLANISSALGQAGQQYAEIEASNARLFAR